MIKINLLGDETVEVKTGTFWLMGYVASLLLFGAICAYMNISLTQSIETATSENRSLESQLTKLKTITAEVKKLEANKNELRQKLAIIATLKRNKIGPVRAMDDLNHALPERAWITDIRQTEGVVKFVGRALDNQTIAAFLKGLEGSDYFQSVELVETRQVQWEGASIKDFIVQAKVNFTGKIVAKPAPAEGTPKPSPG